MGGVTIQKIVAAMAALLLARCNVTEQLAEVRGLRTEINEHVLNPSVRTSAERMRKNPGSHFFDMPVERVMRHLQVASREIHYEMQSNIVRMVHGKPGAERQRIYRMQRTLCETAQVV